MARAMELAGIAAQHNEVPVGAVLVLDGRIMGEGYNNPITGADATAHAEVNAIRDAGQRTGNYRLSGGILYVTLEPCIMCAGAVLHARIDRLVFALRDERFGAAGSRLNLLESPFLNHRCKVVSGIMESESGALIQDFFRARRVPG